MKREEVYVGTETVINYSSLAENLLEIKWKEKYMFINRDCAVLINLERDTRRPIYSGIEATLQIMPPEAEIPKELLELLEKNSFKRE